MPRFLDTDPNLNCQDPRVDPVQCTRSEFPRNVSKYSSGFTQAQRIASSAGLFSIIVSAGRNDVFDVVAAIPTKHLTAPRGLLHNIERLENCRSLKEDFPHHLFNIGNINCHRHLF